MSEGDGWGEIDGRRWVKRDRWREIGGGRQWKAWNMSKISQRRRKER